jgi:hypothetical protein
MSKSYALTRVSTFISWVFSGVMCVLMIALACYSLSMMIVTKDSCKVMTEIAKDQAVYEEISLGSSKIITFPDSFKTTF